MLDPRQAKLASNDYDNNEERYNNARELILLSKMRVKQTLCCKLFICKLAKFMISVYINIGLTV